MYHPSEVYGYDSVAHCTNNVDLIVINFYSYDLSPSF